MNGSHVGDARATGPVGGAAPERATFARELRETCEGAVSRVLAELPARDRRMVEGSRERMVEATHRETMAALDAVVELVEGRNRG